MLVYVGLLLPVGVACSSKRATTKDECGLRSLARASGHELIASVDAAMAARPGCTIAIEDNGIPQQLARARRADDRPADALSMLLDPRDPAVRIRRAELLDRLDRSDEAVRELDGITDEQTLTARRLYTVAAAANASQLDAIERAIAGAPVTERTSLAFRAAAELRALDGLSPTSHELANAIADRIEKERGPAAALAVRERAVAGAPELAEYHDALARSQIASGKTDDALASWKRASEIAPAQSAYRINPIRALVIAGQKERARELAFALAKLAQSTRADQRGSAIHVDLLVTASEGAAIAGDTTLAVQLAVDARNLSTDDGRMTFLLAQRFAEAGDLDRAAAIYAELLICGAHGRPWHRHEVSAKLVELGPRAIAALDTLRMCEVVDAADLKTYVDAIRARL